MVIARKHKKCRNFDGFLTGMGIESLKKPFSIRK